jgi:hypothetical protein
LTVAAWGLGLIIVVAAAVAGGGRLGGEDVAKRPPVASVGPSAEPGAAAVAGLDAVSDAIVLEWPATPNQVITTRELVVRGRLRASAGRVQVLVQSRGSQPILVRTVGPLHRDWDRDHPGRLTFTVTLPLPDPRPSGPAVVQIVAYDAVGRANGVLLRPIQIGAAIDPGSAGLPGRPALGEDGLIGGIPFDTNWSPDTPGS